MKNKEIIEKVCECEHAESFHNLGSKNLVSGCNHIADEDIENKECFRNRKEYIE